MEASSSFSITSAAAGLDSEILAALHLIGLTRFVATHRSTGLILKLLFNIISAQMDGRLMNLTGNPGQPYLGFGHLDAQ